MFYAPKTVATMLAPTELSDLYSDFHKDAIGCRPGPSQWARVEAMTPIEIAVDQARLAEWMEEGDRINALRVEVARFDFSRYMEYVMRREGTTKLGAFMEACESGDRYFFKGEGQDWEYLCYMLKLPCSDAALLKAEYDRLKEEAEERAEA